jgi:hypothetical protein
MKDKIERKESPKQVSQVRHKASKHRQVSGHTKCTVRDYVLKVSCIECGKTYEYPCTIEQMLRYKHGDDAASVFPDLPKSEADFLQTFICIGCLQVCRVREEHSSGDYNDAFRVYTTSACTVQGIMREV